MTKKKKHMRLPSGFGQVRYLGAGRRNAYAVHPPSVPNLDTGRYERPKALCYVDDWYVGFAVLSAYHAGKYKPGDEISIAENLKGSTGSIDDACTSILKSFVKNGTTEQEHKKTFREVFDDWYEWKYGDSSIGKQLSESSKRSMRCAFKNLSALHDIAFEDIRLDDMQAVLDACSLKRPSILNMISLLHQMYSYADARELCKKDYSQHLRMTNAEESEHGIALSDDDIKTLWEHKDEPEIDLILIMCYSGYRISAYKTIEVNLEEGYFKGGVKTKSGKGRIVPIHSAIRALVEKRIKQSGKLISYDVNHQRVLITKALLDIGIEKKYTPHDFRKTFSTLCEKYDVKEADRKRMMGHSFGSDITNAIYSQRTVEELRTEIEKIQVPTL